MFRRKNRFLFALLCTLLLCSFAQATILQITVQDSTDNSIIPRATVFINGVNFGRTNTNGQIFFNNSGLNDTLVKVSMTGYDDWEKIIEKNETSVYVNLSRKNINLRVTLYDSDSLGVVSGAKVNISSGGLTAWQAFADAWVTPFTDATIEWTPTTQLQLGTFTQILHAHVSPILATMRSRKQNVGI